jgi:hypothetical protein
MGCSKEDFDNFLDTQFSQGKKRNQIISETSSSDSSQDKTEDEDKDESEDEVKDENGEKDE